jgi:hypothetical protein
VFAHAAALHDPVKALDGAFLPPSIDRDRSGLLDRVDHVGRSRRSRRSITSAITSVDHVDQSRATSLIEIDALDPSNHAPSPGGYTSPESLLHPRHDDVAHVAASRAHGSSAVRDAVSPCVNAPCEILRSPPPRVLWRRCGVRRRTASIVHNGLAYA